MCAEVTHHKYTDTACFSDAYYVLDNIRPEDRLELEVTGHTAESIIIKTLSNPHIISNVFVSPTTGLPMGLFGVTDLGVIWMISTSELSKHSIRFLKDSRVWINEFHKTHPILWNWVDTRQTLHLKWLQKWLGFTITHEGKIHDHKFYRLEHRQEVIQCVTP